MVRKNEAQDLQAPAAALSPELLREMAGAYYSEELTAQYVIEPQEKGYKITITSSFTSEPLVLHAPTPTFLAEKQIVGGSEDMSFFLERGEGGKITSIIIGETRERGIRLTRL